MSNLVPQPFNQPKQLTKPSDKLLPSELLVRYRKRSGWTQAELAQQVGLEGSRGIRNWETGSSLPRVERLMRLIEVYLAHNIFMQGHEHEEAQTLWQRVKDMFDTTTAKLDTYPPFDENWFEAIWQAYASSKPQEVKLEPKAKTDIKLLPIKATQIQTEVRAANDPHTSAWLEVASNLPLTNGEFVGRAKALLTTKALVQSQSVQVLTLTGTGGSGKTRLAIQIATELLTQFDTKVYFVSLVTVRHLVGVMEAVGSVFGLTTSPDLAEQLQQLLRPHRLLLILDNFEHLLDLALPLQQWLEKLPYLSLLVTSRQKLSLRSEYEFVVPPLELPNLKHLPPLTELLENEAVALFVQRARKVQPSFQPTVTMSQTLAEICARLDGLPLAIELAAAHIQLLTPAAMLARLNDVSTMLRLLASNSAELPSRQQTLRHTLQWSYDLLNQNEQRLFRSLGVFVGGCSLEAVEALNENSEQVFSTLAGLESLISKSLLNQKQVVTMRGYAEARLEMLETVREFALEKLSAADEAETLRQKHLQYYEKVAKQSSIELSGSSQVLWLDELEREHPNFRVALSWGIENEPASALRLAGHLAAFWDLRGHISEGLGWLEQTLATKPEVAVVVTGTALNAAGNYARMLGDYPKAIAMLQQVLELYRQAEFKNGIAIVLTNLGSILSMTGQFAQAEQALVESLARKREIGNPHSIVYTLSALGEMYLFQANYAQALKYFEESLNSANEIGHLFAAALVLINLGAIYTAQANYEKAYECAWTKFEAIIPDRRPQQPSRKFRTISLLTANMAKTSVPRRHSGGSRR